jgi:Mn2+/Fe2+ NRAMP family transporter
MLVLVLVVVVIVAGVVIAVRSGTSTGQGSTAAQVQDASSSARRGLTLGLWCLACGLIAAVGVAMIGQASFGWVPAFDPPGWLRVTTFWMLPVGVVGSSIFGALSLKRYSGRTLGIAGLLLAVLSVVAFFAMVASVDY